MTAIKRIVSAPFFFLGAFFLVLGIIIRVQNIEKIEKGLVTLEKFKSTFQK